MYKFLVLDGIFALIFGVCSIAVILMFLFVGIIDDPDTSLYKKILAFIGLMFECSTIVTGLIFLYFLGW